MKRWLIFLLLTISYYAKLRAQDPHFSQFFASPLTLNPALTGKFNGAYRFAGNYRNQWPTINNAFTTATLSFDTRILENKLPDNDDWGIGFLALTDQQADGVLNNNYFSFSTAYHKGLDEDGYHQLSVGFQGTYASSRLDGTKVTLGDELAPDGTWSIPSNDPYANRVFSVHYFDFNTGILYNGSTSDRNNFYIGASLYHINQPKYDFGDASVTYNLPLRWTIHAGGHFPIADNADIYLSGLHQTQAGASENVIGGAFAINANNDWFDNPTTFYVGSWVRFGDAIIPYVSLEWDGFQLGMSYDTNISSLKTASNERGGIEVSLIYIKKPADPRKRHLNCPKF
jgi:type IX secretion system PorP/SprF family membrane protein